MGRPICVFALFMFVCVILDVPENKARSFIKCEKTTQSCGNCIRYVTILRISTLYKTNELSVSSSAVFPCDLFLEIEPEFY